MKLVFLLSLLLFNIHYCHCQTQKNDSLLLIQSLNEQNNSKIRYQTTFYNIPKILLIFYKSILSEQISANCEFETSCSTFSFQSIDEFGFVKGFFLTADRLTRCGFSFAETPQYLINQNNAKIIDNPSLYHFVK